MIIYYIYDYIFYIYSILSIKLGDFECYDGTCLTEFEICDGIANCNGTMFEDEDCESK